MLRPLIGARFHGLLDDLVTLTYLVGAYVLGLEGTARGIVIVGATVHFLLTRLTNYPQGHIKLIPFRTHAFIELGEGLGVLATTWIGPIPFAPRVFLTLMGFSQLVAFSFSDYAWPPAATARGAA